MDRRPARRLTRRVELLLWVAGAFCVLYVAFVAMQSRTANAASLAISPISGKVVPVEAGHDDGKVIGRLTIPELSLAVPVLSNYETNSLLRGVGHIQGTAMPGGLGTMGLAGHRDTYFRPLRHIKLGMTIDVSDESGVYHYRVDSTEIVTPDEVQVLSIQDRPEMTLITCYPFDFVGAAPKRFIVHAYLLSASPDAPKTPATKTDATKPNE